MQRSIKTAIRNFFAQTSDPRNKDAMSMTLHDCIRLVKPQQPNETIRSAERVETPATKMKWNQGMVARLLMGL
ncbi:hypothetical protein Pla52o_45300 [Novipirellula galeiformis]|uniref:Uncharacterized protein n=1 Tax=Novipirellula galeiformis TaxID=2528004 RepID=A0A5C6CB49_9BACT|nr:hypothetical protein [Novipirellula galeiformis]TWU20651.1 hypothetical protein Pla52o_45300 [Novipirellula galeiformis]